MTHVVCVCAIGRFFWVCTSLLSVYLSFECVCLFWVCLFWVCMSLLSVYLFWYVKRDCVAHVIDLSHIRIHTERSCEHSQASNPRAKLQVSFAEFGLFYRALLQKRLIIHDDVNVDLYQIENIFHHRIDLTHSLSHTHIDSSREHSQAPCSATWIFRPFSEVSFYFISSRFRNKTHIANLI